PLEPAEQPDGLSACTFVSTGSGLLLGRFEHPERPLDLAPPEEQSRQHEAWALVVLERQAEPLLDLDSALEQPRGLQGRTLLRDADTGNEFRKQLRITNSFGFLECMLRVHERRMGVTAKEVHPTALPEDPRRPGVVVCGVSESFVAPPDADRR